MCKLPDAMRRISSYSVIFALTLLTLTCAFKEMNFTILFRDAGDLEKGSLVFLDETEIGRVTSIKPQDEKMAVKVQIFHKYRNIVKEKSEFYILGSGDETRIQIQIPEESSLPLRPGTTVEGSPEYMYWMRKGIRKIEEWIKKGIEKTQELFESDEWKEFKDKMKEETNKTKKERGRGV